MTEEASDAIRIFSARACAAPLEKATAAFTESTGIPVNISVCARHCAKQEAEEADPDAGAHDFLVEIAEYGVHDLAIGGAEYLLDDGEVRGIVRKGERRLIAYRRSALVVPAGNPAGIKSIDDVARPGVRVGISVIDCLKGLWEDITGRAGLTDEVRRNVTFHATGCVAIVEAVAQGLVDVAFGWTAFAHMGEGRLEVVELPDAHVVQRGTGVGMLSFSKDPDRARRLMDYLTTDSARAAYKEFGWVLPSEARLG
ncbi:MAG: substrate-binding domain-containing protein [Planctomycetota bacterium]|jgi:molybdate transport system substrate-binding protein